MYWNDGDRYEGEWKNDDTHGKGIYYYSNGSREMGDYADGLIAFWNGTSPGTKDMIDYMEKLGKLCIVIPF